MPKKKIAFRDEEEEQEEKYEEVWDIRKIVAGVVVLLLLIFGGLVAKRILLHESLAPTSFIPHLPSVAGVSTGPGQNSAPHVQITLPNAEQVQNQIQTIQNQVTHLNVAEVATSSPQVQQILKQIENLPSGPEGQVKATCMRLCNNL